MQLPDNVLLARSSTCSTASAGSSPSRRTTTLACATSWLSCARRARASRTTSTRRELLLMRTLPRQTSPSSSRRTCRSSSRSLDLFPGISASGQWPWLEGPLLETMGALGLQPPAVARQSDRAVGDVPRAPLAHARRPSGVGKTRILEVLMGSLSACTPSGSAAARGREPPRATDEPEAITAPQMFARWTWSPTSGRSIFAQLWRKANKDKKSFT